jgi:hypothetical protein
MVQLVSVGMLMTGCNGNQLESVSEAQVANPQFEGGGILHRVSVGSHDFVPPGDDANFSLIAIQYADGSVRGQYTDQFGHGNAGIHVVVDCLEVVGNQAWISGVVQGGPYDGEPTTTRVEDNGTSENDPPDQISFSIHPALRDCHAMRPLPLFPLTGGEVKVE